MNKLLLLLLCSFSTVGCQKSETQRKTASRSEVSSFQGIAMTVPYRIEIGKNLSTTKQAEVQNTIDATFNEIDRVYNKWNKNSELSKLNRLPANQPESISNELAHFLRRCDYFVKLSKGKFDPTIEALQQVWKDHLEKGTLPSENEIKIAQATVGWDTITLKNNVFTKKHSATALDLGGIAKGYTVDLMVERLQKMGYNSVFVEWGGEIRASGKHPQGRSWAVYISNLEDLNPEHALAYVPLTNQAIATSGDYLQNWIVDGTTYFHVFDPQTGKPLALTDTSIASASCLANDCMTADALATMLVMCKTLDEAKALATELQTEIPGTVFWLMSRKKNDK